MTTTIEQHAPDLREYLRVLRVRKKEVVLVTLLLVASTLFFTFRQTPIYEGQAKVLVRPIQPATSSAAIPQAPNLDTERELVLSDPVARKVEQILETDTPMDQLLQGLRVQVVTDTEVLLVKYADPSPAQAARLAGAFADAYVESRGEQTLTQYQAAASAVQKRIDAVQNRVASLNDQLESAPDPESEREIEAQRDGAVAQLGVLQQRLLDLQANASVNQNSAEVIQPAEIPDSPASPNKVRNGVMALFAGLALGVGFAFLRERLDDRLKTRHELERRLGAPVIAAVPKVAGWRKREEAQLIMRSDPKSPVSEAYRTLGTNIQYMASRQPLKVVMVTSSLGGDGKTTSASNLAVVLSQAGKRVILVSADLRRPRLHHFFGLTNDRGLSDILSDTTPLAHVAKDPRIPNLRIVTAGPVPNDPAALLGGRRAEEVVHQLRDVADFVIIDTPPVLAVADASILAPLVDGTIFVIDGERSSRSAMVQARDQLETAGAKIVGAVFNNFDPSQSAYYPYYYYNYYYQYYGADEASANGNGSKGRRRSGRRSRRSPRREIGSEV